MLDLIILLLAIIGISAYLWLTWNYDYWKKQGVPYITPSLLFGTTKDYTLCRENSGVILKQFYDQYPDEPVLGLFKMRQPQLMIKDIELVKTIFIKEFSTFHDNDFYVDEKVDPVMAVNPFIIRGEKWKNVRSLHSQQQTSGKIKSMYPLMKGVNKDMIQFMDKKQGDKIESKYFSGQYTTDVVGSCIYGLHTNSFLDPDAKFRKMTAKLFQPGILNNVAFVLSNIAPKIASTLNLKWISDDVTNFFYGIVRDVRDHRVKNNIVRNDFLGSLIEESKKDNTIINSIEQVTAHSLTFFFDGYETSSILMGFALYILALYQDIQQKLRDELNNAENLEYDTIHSLPYLDAVILETLRMYPPAPVSTRVCNKDTEIEFKGKKYNFKKGMTATISVMGIHMDPKNFQTPEIYNPERFYKKPLSPCFLSFGIGPRACLGQRFALTQIKSGLGHIIKNFRVLPALENAKLPEINPKSSFLVLSKDPMWVKFEKIDQLYE